MKRQDEILVWMAESFSEEDFPLKTGQLYEKFVEGTGYEGSEAAFSEMLGKLKKRGLLDNPQYGSYRPSEEGWSRASKLESGGDSRPAGFDALVNVLENLIGSYEKESVLLKFSEIHEFNNDAFDDLRNNPDIFREALQNARKNSGKKYVRLWNDLGGFNSEWSDLRNGNVEGEIVNFEGTIKDVSERFTLRKKVVFECESCGRRFEEESILEEVNPPGECPCGGTSFDEAGEKRRDAKEFILEGEASVRCVLYDLSIPDEFLEDIRLGNRVDVTGVLKFTEGRVSKPFIDVMALRQTSKVDKERYSEKNREKVRQKVKLISQNQNPFEIFANSLAPEVKGRKTAKRAIAASLIGCGKKDISTLVIDSRKGSDVLVKELSKVFSDGVHALGTLKPEVHYEDVKWIRNGELLRSREGILFVQDLDKMEKKDLRMLSSVLSTGRFSAGSEDYEVDNSVVASAHKSVEEDMFDLVCKVEGSSLDDFSEDYTENHDYMLEEELEIYRAVAKEVNPEVGEDAKEFLENSREWEDAERWELVLALTATYARARLSEEADLADAEDGLSLLESLEAS